ncbi:hypothetical protein CERZMDRAFT_97269 [Cercospora zeae-maydis SCOH1-5]|uniref:Uncharacterized protein n=1 Tax=Cercospora zeae-maydis SCOH1-5 TaxID=717836 RepID=A0A6A6FHB2_9PEZI|nr:hypothetical protein CERZMDRAFT_97269 [Cercospora zeae-maydis SCOH1-5]
MLHRMVRCRPAAIGINYKMATAPMLPCCARTKADIAGSSESRDVPQLSSELTVNAKGVREQRVRFIAAKNRPPMSQADHQAEVELKRDPLQAGTILQRHTDHGSVSLNILCLCLEYSWDAVRSYWRRERHSILEDVRATQFGRRALLSCLQEPSFLLAMARSQRSCCDYLAYFAVNEDLEQIFYQCLRLPLNDGKFGLHWRGRLLSSLCCANFMHNTSQSADRALHTLFEGYEAVTSDLPSLDQQSVQDKDRAKLEDQHLAFSHALFSMRSLLADRSRLLGYPDTDPDLYDEFIELFKKSKLSAFDQAWDIARLHMYHPRKLDDQPAVRLLRDVAQNGFPTDSRVVRDRKRMAKAISDFLTRAAVVAEANENYEDAQWILTTFEKRMHRAFSMTRKSAKAEIRNREMTPMIERLLWAATRDSIPFKRLPLDQVSDSEFWEATADGDTAPAA